MTDELLLGMGIGGVKSAVVLGDGFGNIFARQEFPTTSPEQTLERLINAARALSVPAAGRTAANSDPAAAGASERAILARPVACGVACGGPLSSAEGMILSPPNLPGWDFVPVARLLEEELKVTTRLENDANAAALAEWRWGLGQRIDDLVYLTCSTGMGAGIVLDGRLHRGRQDLAGEVGHVRLLQLGPVGYHKAGSVEGLTSMRGLGELTKLRLLEIHQSSALDKVPSHSLDGYAVAEAALAGDAFARSVIKESAGYLGRTCAILIDVLNPQRISLGGIAVRLGKFYVDEVRRAAREEALHAAYDACDIDAAALGHRTQDLAALAVASLAAEDAESDRRRQAERARDDQHLVDPDRGFDPELPASVRTATWATPTGGRVARPVAD